MSSEMFKIMSYVMALKIILLAVFLVVTSSRYAVLAAQEEAVLLSGQSASSVQDKAVAELRGKLGANGITLTEISADEADIQQAGILNNGGPVVVAEPQAKGGYKVYDGTYGEDITKKFNSGFSPKEEPAPAVVFKPKPEPKKIAKPAPQPQAKEVSSFKNNRIGLSIGFYNLKRNADGLDVLARGNAGAQVGYTKTIGRFRLFYERDLSRKYGFGIAAGADKGTKAAYDNSGRTLNIDATPKSAMLYFTRYLGRHFGLYLGGGADVIVLHIKDQSNLAGMSGQHPPFKESVATPYGETGIIFGAGSLSLRFSLKQTFGGAADNLNCNVNGVSYRLIVRNDNTLSYKTDGQALAANEKYFKLNMGGFASAITLNYAFAAW